MYKWAEYTAEECTKTTRTLLKDKSKAAQSIDDLDFSFHDLDIGWEFKTSDKALKNMVKQRQGPGTGASASSAEVPVPAPVPTRVKNTPLALEDAKERDKTMLKLEEALKNTPHLTLKAKRLTVVLPETTLGKDHNKKIESQKEVIDKLYTQLETVSLYGTLPGGADPIELDKLKEIIKEFHEEFELMQNFVKMASVLVKK